MREGKEKEVRAIYYMLILIVFIVAGGGWLLYSSFDRIAELSKAETAPVYPPSVDLYAVCFGGNDKNLWAVGQFGTVIHSDDGAKSWMRQKTDIDESLLDVYFIDSKLGWMITAKTLFRTDDGGENWKEVKEFPRSLTALEFYDRDNGWIVGEEIILHSSDGGETWDEQEYIGEPTIFRDIATLSADELWIAGEGGRVFYTVDAGNNWKEKGSNNTNTIFSIDALDSSNIWTVGLAGEIYYTEDGGDTWIPCNFPSKRNLYFVKVMSELKAIVAGDGILNMTHLKGRDWRGVLIDKDIEYKWIYDIAGFGEKMCAVGEGGEFAILLSENKGKTWNVVQYD